MQVQNLVFVQQEQELSPSWQQLPILRPILLLFLPRATLLLYYHILPWQNSLLQPRPPVTHPEMSALHSPCCLTHCPTLLCYNILINNIQLSGSLYPTQLLHPAFCTQLNISHQTKFASTQNSATIPLRPSTSQPSEILH